MEKKLLLILLVISVEKVYPQAVNSFQEIQAVDSIAKTKGVASCFAILYIKTMLQVEEQLSRMDSATVNQIRKLELNFAGYFLKACRQFNDSSYSDKNWDAYFRISNPSPLQLKLLGINAHINGDLWRALKDSYPAGEIKGMNKTVFLFHRSLLYIYKDVYREAVAESKKMKTLNAISLGLSEKYGRQLLSKWRKRQLKLARFYYFKPYRFEQKRNKIEVKKNRIDNLITSRL